MACALPHLLFFLFLLPFSGVAQTNGGNVSIGASLSAAAEADSWLSQSGDFAFGFKEQGGTNLFLLSIWFDKIPEKTIVWYANEGNTVPRGSKVELTADRGLVLTNPQGNEIWKSDPLVGSVAYGYMSNTGNFVLKDGNLQELWESFRVPTDTMLPTQELEKGYVLTSRKTETSFSKGRFQLSMLDNGNLWLTTINLPTDHRNEPYFTSETQDDNDASNAGSRFVFNQSGYIYVLRANGQKSMLSQGGVVSATDNYLRATLDFDGVFAEYYHPKTSSGNESCGLNRKIFAQQVLCLKEVALAVITAFASSTRMEGRLVRAHEGIPCSIQVIDLVAANRISRRAARMTMNNYMILLSYPTLTGHFLITCCWSLSTKRSAEILAWETACALFPFTEIIAVGRRGYHSQMGELLELKGARHLSKSGKILILPHRVLVFPMRRSRERSTTRLKPSWGRCY